MFILLLIQTVTFSMDDVLKQKIDESLKIAKEKGLLLTSDQKCPNDCIKKKGSSLSDFLGSEKSQEKEKEKLLKNERVIFISHSMPKEALEGIVEFSKRNPVRLVIQGMIQNSMVKTAKFVEEIGVPVDIDPPLFKNYAVTHVPVFLERQDQKTVLMSGNVTPQFAFQKFTEKREAS